MSKKVVAIILARGGSKGIPRKNVLNFAGHPLVAWSIIQAKNTDNIDEVYVSSDSEEILKIADKYGAKTINRPDEFASDIAKSEDAILHAMGVLEDEYEIVIMLEPTAPLREPKDLGDAVKMFRSKNWDSCFSGATLQDFLIWKKNHNGDLISVNYDYKKQGPRQMREPDYVENGAIYMFKPKIMLEEKNRFGGKIGIFPNHFWQSFEIDEPDDWDFVELVFNKYLLKKYIDMGVKV
jgi:CMP-N,N'-diacetyllegionaminic acid synthase